LVILSIGCTNERSSSIVPLIRQIAMFWCTD
jgi:hypothetical protein